VSKYWQWVATQDTPLWSCFSFTRVQTSTLSLRLAKTRARLTRSGSALLDINLYMKGPQGHLDCIGPKTCSVCHAIMQSWSTLIRLLIGRNEAYLTRWRSLNFYDNDMPWVWQPVPQPYTDVWYLLSIAPMPYLKHLHIEHRNNTPIPMANASLDNLTRLIATTPTSGDPVNYPVLKTLEIRGSNCGHLTRSTMPRLCSLILYTDEGGSDGLVGSILDNPSLCHVKFFLLYGSRRHAFLSKAQYLQLLPKLVSLEKLTICQTLVHMTLQSLRDNPSILPHLITLNSLFWETSTPVSHDFPTRLS
jgi:hypothetical protein